MMFLLLLLAACAGVLVGEVKGADRPKLDVGEQVIIRLEDQNFFRLQCQGSQNVTWSWSSTLPNDLAMIETREQDNSVYPFVSTFMVEEPAPEDTGFYYCHYENFKDLQTDKDRVASTYVYVYDGHTILVHSGYISSMVVRTNEKLVLDCRTTLPNATVTLIKDGEEVPLNAHHTRWDPKIGFVILSLTVQDSGHYMCQSQSTGDIQTTTVQVRPSSSKLQSPSIDQGLNQYFVVGEPFFLNCTLVKESVEVVLHWEYPNAAVMYPYNTSRYGEGDDRYTFSTLYIPVASKKDSGKYTCTATASQYDPSSDSLEITVQDNLTPHVRIVSSSEISVEEGDVLKWRADVFSFPPNPRIVYTDWQGNPLRKSSRIEMEYDPFTSFSWLRIHNVTGSDFGRYTLTATTTDNSATGNATATIEVRSKPLVEVKGVPSYLMPMEKLHITCLTQGFPVPSLAWEFQPCHNSLPSCSEFENITDDELSLQHPAPGNLIMSDISLTPKSSGFLRCLANNSLGTHNNTVRVAISDIAGLHVLRYTIQNTTKEFPTTNITLITNDRFLLTCGANKLLYKSVELNTPQRFEIEVVERELEYSWLRDIKVDKVTTVMQGEYSCVAHTHDNNNNQIKTLNVNVLEETKVSFLHNSNMVKNNTVHVKENAPYSLNCTVGGMPKPSITWTKDGKPLSPDSEFFHENTVLLSEDQQRIELKYVKSKHQGVYMCQAENRVNKVTGRLTIVMPAAGLSTGGKVGLAVALIGIAFLIITVVVLVRRVKTERKFRKSFRANELYLFQKGNIGQLNPDCSADEQAELLPYGHEWEVPRNHITLGKQLGSGAFGRVVKASVTGLEGPAATTVAIKMCKSQADPSQVRALALELKIMIHLGKHLNIVNLMGANTTHIGKGELWILVEYCRFGNLLLFMHRHRRSFINQIEPTTGRIDPTKLTPDTNSLLSPVTPGSSWQHSNSRRPSHEGLRSAKSNNPFVLSPPPEGYMIPRSPPHPVQTPQSNGEGYQTPRSPPPVVETPQGHTHDRFSATSNNHFVESEAPSGYQVPLSPPPAVVSPQAHNPLYNPTIRTPGGARILPVPQSTDNTTSESCCSDEKTLETSTSTASDGRVQNTYFSSTTASNMSQGPLSPEMLDSQGNVMVHEVGSVPGVNSPFTTTDLMCWAWQVAHGMDYLASRKVLHGDLAARNLLLSDDNVVKISDFGLSREMYKKDIYMKKSDDLMPIKWISVEAIRDRIFSVQSDVWAFGVTLWEIFSLGSTPYPGIEVNNDFLTLLEEGYRMSCPKYANEDIYKLLLECWEAEPMDRPSFTELLLRLDAMLRPDIKTEYLSMNDQYMRMNEERFKDQPDYLNMLTQPDYENMTNKGNEDDIKPHYLNMEVAGVDRRDTVGQAGIQLQGEVVYCNMKNLSPDPTLPTNQYLPMNITRNSPGLEDDVFSPCPSEDKRFNYHNEKTSSPDVPTKEDKLLMQDIESKGKTLDTEHSTLISNGRGST